MSDTKIDKLTKELLNLMGKYTHELYEFEIMEATYNALLSLRDPDSDDEED